VQGTWNLQESALRTHLCHTTVRSALFNRHSAHLIAPRMRWTDEVNRTLDSSMERLLELLLKQSLADGYEISKTYGQEMMVRNSWKLVAALAVAKADIDKRLFSVASHPLLLTVFQVQMHSSPAAGSAGPPPTSSQTLNQNLAALQTRTQPP